MTNSRPAINLPWWKFLLPFSLQLAIVLLVPAKSAYTYNFGRDAVIQTVPRDPYDLLRGYSQTLSYNISRTSDLKSFPGGENLNNGSIIYLILEADPSLAKTPPSPWKSIKVTTTIPTDLPKNQIALKGKVTNYGSIVYGLETYYVPENQRDKINQEISDLQNDSEAKPGAKRDFVVEIKVDRWGNSVPVSLWVNKKNYRF